MNLDEIIKTSKIGYIRHKHLDSVVHEYLKKIGDSKGLIYVGANTGQEIPLLKPLAEKIYAFEAISAPSVWGRLITHTDNQVSCFNYALSDEEGQFEIYLASNNYESSSLFKPGTHVSEFPHVQFSSTPITVQTRRLDTFGFIKDCDTIIMDVQGAELKVLNGLSDYSNIKLIILEFVSKDLYIGSCTFDELYNKLIDENFKYMEAFDVYQSSDNSVFAGNAVFLKNNLF